MDPEDTDPTTQVMVHFGCELVGKIQRLEDQLKAQQETLKRYQRVIDDQRESLSLPRIYEKFPINLTHRSWSSFLCNKTLVARVKLSQVESSSVV